MVSPWCGLKIKRCSTTDCRMAEKIFPLFGNHKVKGHDAVTVAFFVEPAPLCAFMDFILETPITPDDIPWATGEDPTLGPALDFFHTSWPQTTLSEEFPQLRSRRGSLSFINSCLKPSLIGETILTTTGCVLTFPCRPPGITKWKPSLEVIINVPHE
ncbi:hypothetical protein D915_008642 [Fasciola hepatica]|uniref:Uncharacterized protein n=1 Tax=Fasciola hepatica TaxID=6192 RepID=A0A4E0R2N9_FASHE|nr:hypothetical protein D915_008642 [Fasciola hepatica]